MGPPDGERRAASAEAEGNSGIYCLILRLDRGARLTIGKHGTHSFAPGYYCYVGSAMGNLAQRLARHRSREKRPHWHIDYLLAEAELEEVLAAPTKRRLECGLSRRVAALTAGPAVAGFGSSDCSCPTHLHYFKSDPRALVRPILERLDRYFPPDPWGG